MAELGLNRASWLQRPWYTALEAVFHPSAQRNLTKKEIGGGGGCSVPIAGGEHSCSLPLGLQDKLVFLFQRLPGDLCASL